LASWSLRAFCCVTLLLAPACEGPSPGAPRSAEPVVWDSAGVSIVEWPSDVLEVEAPFRLADEPVFSVGTLDGPEELRFTSVVAGRRLPDGGFIVIDDRETLPVRVFSEDGRFRMSIGRRGEGPGEFGRPTRVATDPAGGVLVWDSGHRRLHRFDLEGRWEGDLRSDVLGEGDIVDFAPVTGDTFLLLREEGASGPPEPGLNRRSNTARLLRAAGELDTLAAFPGTDWELRVNTQGGEIRSIEILRPWYLPRLLHAFTRDGVWLTNGVRWEVERRDPRFGRTDMRIRITREPEPFTPARVRELRQSLLAAVTDEAEADAVRDRVARSEYPPHIPPVAELFADEEDRIWIGHTRFPPPPRLPWAMGTPVRDWLLIEGGGPSAVGRLRLPPGSRPLHADAEGVLLVLVDELEIPRVEWWPFVEGGGS
jgi:hypothetical protein